MKKTVSLKSGEVFVTKQMIGTDGTPDFRAVHVMPQGISFDFKV